jgi:hypothetical protein
MPRFNRFRPISIGSTFFTVIAVVAWGLVAAGVRNPVILDVAGTSAAIAAACWLASLLIRRDDDRHRRDDDRYRQVAGEYRRREAALIRTAGWLAERPTEPMTRLLP